MTKSAGESGWSLAATICGLLSSIFWILSAIAAYKAMGTTVSSQMTPHQVQFVNAMGGAWQCMGRGILGPDFHLPRGGWYLSLSWSVVSAFV